MYKIFSHLPTGIYQLDDVSNGSDDWAGRKYELPSGYRMHHNAAADDDDEEDDDDDDDDDDDGDDDDDDDEDDDV